MSDIPKPVVFKSVDEMPEVPVSVANTLYNRTGSWRNLKPVIREKTGPCATSCPLWIDIPVFMDLLGMGKVEEALQVILKRNPFPSLTGRLCPRTCEIACNRNKFDEAISIRALERFLGDLSLGKKGKPPKKETARRVAIIGSGPAGLTAAFLLRQKGHMVDVFERYKKPGGHLAKYVPPYKLPPYIMESEITDLEKMGVKFNLKKEVGKDIPFEKLMETYDAIYIASGYSKEVPLDIPGGHLAESGLKILERTLEGNVPGENRFAIIGSGLAAFHLARTLKRLGKDVLLVAEATEKGIKVPSEDVERAREEGVEILLETKVKGIKEKTDRRILEIEGPEGTRTLEAEMVVNGNQGQASLDFLPSELLEGNRLKVDIKTAATPMKGVFGGSDPANIARAIAWGRKAAISIDQFLNGQEFSPEARPPLVVGYKEIQTEYFLHEKRRDPKVLSVKERFEKPWDEEVLQLSETEAIKEALRCFSCGHCNSCGNCWVYCPDQSILWVDNAPQVNYDYCKGCGICTMECPRGIIDLVPERE